MKLIIRTDASFQIGSGHVMRNLSLAYQIRQSGAEVTFICRMHEGNLADLIRSKGFEVRQLLFYQYSVSQHEITNTGSYSEYLKWLGVSQEQDAEDTVEVINGSYPDWLIVDHYAIDKTWELLVRPYVKKIMVIDDLADRKHDCDLLLDQNYVRDGRQRYTDLISPACTILLGPQYALLRQEFAETRKILRKRDGSVQRVFVFFGGVDPDNITGKALEALSAHEFSHIHVDIVIGAANPHRESIFQAVTQRPLTTLHVQVENIAEIMAQSDLAICAGGTTTWERFCLGLPSLVFTVADNQVPFTRNLHKDGLLRWIGTSKDVDTHTLRNELKQALQDTDRNRQEAELGMNLIDGYGAIIVAHLLLKGPIHESLRVRRVNESDCKLFWYWVNDPEVRKNAFNSDLIPWKSHKTWFFKKMRDPYTTIYVIECDQGSIGQVRFEKINEQYLISYSLGRAYRAMGLGKKVLQMAIESFQKSQVSFILRAEVKHDNVVSCIIFLKLGFVEKNYEIDKRVFELSCS